MLEKIDKNYFELNESKEPDGKRRFKVSLHEIYPDRTQTNMNGICYLREYTERNMQSVIGMPICCQFADGRKASPVGHGSTGIRNTDGMPLYEDSVVVGSFDTVSIEEAVIEGQQKLVLMGTGFIYEQRYPRLVEWIEGHLNSNMLVHGSVEFVGKKEHDGLIQYELGASDEFRVPTDYLYSGYCLLTVPAGDEAAILFELNEKKEGNEMNEELKRELNEVIVGAFNGLRETENALRAEIEQLKGELDEKDKTINELNQKIADAEQNAAAKDEEVEKAKEAEKNGADLLSQVQGELNKLKADNIVAQFNSAMKGFTDAQMSVAKDEIEAFKADPIAHEAEINSITDKIEAAAYRVMKENERKAAEANSKRVGNLFSYVDDTAAAKNIDESDDPHKIFG